MTAPTIDERDIDEPEVDDDPAPLPTTPSELDQLKNLLTWARKNRFSFGVVQLGGITLHGVQDHLPRKGQAANGDAIEFPGWMDDYPDAKAALVTADKES